MAKINLLPWRDERREKKKREFILTSVFVAIIGALLAGAVWMYFNNQLADQEAANQYVQQQNADLDEKLKALDGLKAQRDAIEARMKVINDLQGVRPVIVHIFDEITRLTPANIYLTEFSRTGDKFTLTGKAESPEAVAGFLRNLGTSVWFRNAFMSSFIAAEPVTKQEGGVVPRIEESYGTFVVTVDLGDFRALTAVAPQGASAPVASTTPASAVATN